MSKKVYNNQILEGNFDNNYVVIYLDNNKKLIAYYDTSLVSYIVTVHDVLAFGLTELLETREYSEREFIEFIKNLDNIQNVIFKNENELIFDLSR